MPLKLEVGKSYRTRDGRKCTISHRDGKNEERGLPRFSGYVDGDSAWQYDEDGVWTRRDMSPTHAYATYDLVAPWTEEGVLIKTPSTKRQRAEALCAQVNAFEAELRRDPELRGMFEFGSLFPAGTWKPVEEQHLTGYRLIPEKPPLPEPTTIGNYPVSLLDDGKTVAVGCTKFLVSGLRVALEELLAGRTGRFPAGDKTLSASRQGISRSDYNEAELSWTDAEQLLAYLKQVPQ